MPIRDPFSVWRPFSGKSKVPLKQDIVCVHTMVGTLAGSWDWANRPGTPYWHYGVNGVGTAWQCHDLAFRSAANLNGNHRVIPIETSDMKEGVFPNTWTNPPWTDAQVAMLIKLIAWLCIRFNIPPVLIPDTKPGRRGLAYHRQGIAPQLVPGGEIWSKAAGKSCPAARVQQFINVVIPGVRKIVLKEDDVGLTDGERRVLDGLVKSVKEVDDRSQKTLILLRDNLLGDNTAGRANGKTLLIGALAHGLREPEEGENTEDGKGHLIAPFKRLLREVLAEAHEPVPSEPAPTEGVPNG